MDEKTLIERAGKGDEAAFETLVRTHEKMVYNLALRMTGSREDAFDLSQTTFLKAWHAISLFQFDSKFSTWLCRIASNTCIDFLRKEKRRGVVSLTVPDEADRLYELSVADERLNPAVIVEVTAQRDAVFQALQALPKDYRVALSLRAIEDMSYEEIAEALDVKAGTVKSRISRAREMLRQHFAGNLSEDTSSKQEKGGGAEMKEVKHTCP